MEDNYVKQSCRKAGETFKWFSRAAMRLKVCLMVTQNTNVILHVNYNTIGVGGGENKYKSGLGRIQETPQGE